jgi:OOP family OmpA-OmpF porin
MGKNLFIIFCFFICSLSYAVAQNFVPNPGFEVVAKMPSKRDPGIHCAKQWRTPTFTGSDYYHAAAEKCNGAPKNRFGIQKPHSGKAYAGICIKTDYFEYLSATLTDTLIKGQDYLVEFYYCKAEKSKCSLKEFGVLFTNKMSWRLDYKGISEQPNLDFTDTDGYRNEKEWTKISATYHAEGFETVIILGNFNYNSPSERTRFCHYYIDDVSVIPLKSEDIELKSETNLYTFPSISNTITAATVYTVSVGSLIRPLILYSI